MASASTSMRCVTFASVFVAANAFSIWPFSENPKSASSTSTEELTFFLAELPQSNNGSLLTVGRLLPDLKEALSKRFHLTTELQSKEVVAALVHFHSLSDISTKLLSTLARMTKLVILRTAVGPLSAQYLRYSENLTSASQRLGAARLRSRWDLYWALRLAGYNTMTELLPEVPNDDDTKGRTVVMRAEIVTHEQLEHARCPGANEHVAVDCNSTNGEAATRAQVEQLGPWTGQMYLPGGVWTVPIATPTLTGKLAQLVDLVQDRLGGSLRGKRVLDIGSNQGYTSLECALRGATVVAIEPFAANFARTQLVARAHGLLLDSSTTKPRAGRGSIDVQSKWSMENISVATHGRFDAIFFLGTVYHCTRPWVVARTYASMTELMAVESKLAAKRDINDHAGSPQYGFHRFAEGPGTALDDPKKNYLRRVEAADVRVPTRDTLGRIFRDAGFGVVSHVYPTRMVTDDGVKLYTSDQYFREQAGMLLVEGRRAAG